MAAGLVPGDAVLEEQIEEGKCKEEEVPEEEMVIESCFNRRRGERIIKATARCGSKTWPRPRPHLPPSANAGARHDSGEEREDKAR